MLNAYSSSRDMRPKRLPRPAREAVGSAGFSSTLLICYGAWRAQLPPSWLLTGLVPDGGGVADQYLALRTRRYTSRWLLTPRLKVLETSH